MVWTLGRGAIFTGALLFASTSAQAHVKWFAPYIVGAPPQSLSSVLKDTWFWIGIALVVVFFVLTRLIEISPLGNRVHDALDRSTDVLWKRLDDYVRVTVGAFFVAIFSVGGVYLTPDLRTPAEWVSWLQLAIAACIFFRKTMPLAGIGILALWLLAIRDYDLFHLFDYLALGAGVAAYLILEPSKNENLRSHRFEALRWGLAIALMWSSLEKIRLSRLVLSPHHGKAVPDVRTAARRLYSDGWRCGIHYGFWSFVDPSDPTSFGHCPHHHLHCCRLAIRTR